MKTRYLTAILCVLLLSAVASAQNDVFPNCHLCRAQENFQTIQRALNSLSLLRVTIARQVMRSNNRRSSHTSSKIPDDSNRPSFSGPATQSQASESPERRCITKR